MKILKNLFFKIYRLFNKQKNILFESGNNEFDNGFVFFKYCLDNNCFPNKKLILVSKAPAREYKTCINKKNFFHFKKGRINSFKLYLLSRNSDVIYFTYDNFWNFMELPEIKFVYLNHGEFPVKSVKSYFDSMFLNKNHYYALCTTNYVKNIMVEHYHYDNVTYFVSGQPRNELLKVSNFKNKQLSFESANKKIILMATTFRAFQQKADFFESEFPIKMTEQELMELNDYCEKQNVILLFKIHHSQYIDKDNIKYPNIKFINNMDLSNNDMNNFDLFVKSDALITDFSSIYIGYLLLNKPIGFIYSDLEFYKQNRGLTIDNIEDVQPGDKIHNLDEFKKFIYKIALGIDSYKDDRLKVKEMLLGNFDDSCSALVQTANKNFE